MKKLAFLGSSVLSFLSPALTLAADPIQIQKPAGVGFSTIGNFISNILTVVFSIAILAVLVMLIWGAFEWITSGGDKAGVESAQHRIQAALLGLFIVFAASSIMLVAQAFFGICLGIGCDIIITPINKQ